MTWARDLSAQVESRNVTVPDYTPAPAVTPGPGRSGSSFGTKIATGKDSGAPHQVWMRSWDERPSAGTLRGKEFNDVIMSTEGDAEALLHFVGERLREFSIVNAVTALHRLAKTAEAQVANDPRMQSLTARIAHIFNTAVPKNQPSPGGGKWTHHVDLRALTNTVWAQAKMGVSDPAMHGHVAEEVIKRISESTSQQIANCAWAFAKLIVRNDRLLTALGNEASGRMDEFSPQNLMTLVWAYAKMHFLHSAVMTAATGAATKNLRSFTPQHLSIMSWALATLGFRDLRLIEGVALESMKTMGLFRPQNLANLAWAHATLDVKHDKLFSAISLMARLRLDEFNQQHMCNLAWAFSTLQVIDEELMLAIAEQVISRSDEFNTQGLACMACAFSVIGLAHHELFDTLAAGVIDRVDQCTPRDLESIAWAFARLGLAKDVLMSAISSAAFHRIHEFQPLDLANVGWAFATLGIQDIPLMEALGAESVRQVTRFSLQALGHTAWAFSTLSCAYRALMDAISAQVLLNVDHLETPHLAVLLDADLECKAVLGRRMGAVLWRFLEAFPGSAEEWERPEYLKFLRRLQVDNFGASGSRFLLTRLGIERAPWDFQVSAQHQMRAYIQKNNEVLKDLTTKEVLHKRVCCFTEYSLAVPVGDAMVPLRGVMMRENGYWSASAARGGTCRWLRAATGLRVGALVDRVLCSEFQTLEELCDNIERAGGTPERRCDIQGGVRAFISTTPCVSCIGAMSQFRVMFPNVTLEISFGNIPMRQGWKRDASCV